MRALRPYLIVGAAIVGAGVIVAVPATPPLPDIQVPAVQPADSELSGFNQQDLLGALANIEGAISVPDIGGLNPAGESPDLGALFGPGIAPPELGPLDLGGLDLGGLEPGTAPGPANPPAVP